MNISEIMNIKFNKVCTQQMAAAFAVALRVSGFTPSSGDAIMSYQDLKEIIT